MRIRNCFLVPLSSHDEPERSEKGLGSDDWPPITIRKRMNRGFGEHFKSKNDVLVCALNVKHWKKTVFVGRNARGEGGRSTVRVLEKRSSLSVCVSGWRDCTEPKDAD
jgi:hypothetical protein